ncbi:hypothetical protein KCH_51870 [Kitasatospora cheerisanensis KCTC 2395]|uniref:Uncharacterized protein n=1 Tax=Kitasatospora cheerisanensis KCTC 2395 TaxID=1348663 RepID=A0A066YY82_9ACTN|nr:hypothetical protein KCH_51870 [Kitasatospora cheerisanensis KCTC 2395]
MAARHGLGSRVRLVGASEPLPGPWRGRETSGTAPGGTPRE